MHDLAVFGLVVAGRLLLPLLIPRFPLPAILACLVLDGVDQTIFQKWTDLDLTSYQSYDKALDVYYLAIAYLSTLRNWTNQPAVGIARFLFYYRQVGVVLFELTHWRAVLLVFPNTFEYFFICYEVVRLLWDPRRMSRGFLIGAAAAIWVFVKLPQEYWIHIAQKDMTDTLRQLAADSPGLLVGGVVLVVAALTAAVVVVRRRAPQPDHRPRLAADPLPAAMDTAAERSAYRIAKARFLDVELFEKIVFVALTSVVFAEMLPGVSAGPGQVAVGIAVVVTFTSFAGLWTARRIPTLESTAATFLVLMTANVVFVAVTEWLLGRGQGRLQSGATLFFLALLTLMVVLYDRYRPVYRTRFPAGAPQTVS